MRSLRIAGENGCGFPSHLSGRLVFPQADVNCVPQEIVRRPRQVGDFDDETRLDPMNAREDERRAEAG